MTLKEIKASPECPVCGYEGLMVQGYNMPQQVNIGWRNGNRCVDCQRSTRYMVGLKESRDLEDLALEAYEITIEDLKHIQALKLRLEEKWGFGI